MGHAGIGRQVATDGAEKEALIRGQKASGKDARAVRADVDGLTHGEVVALAEVQAHEHALRDTFFGALTRGGTVHRRISLPGCLGNLGAGVRIRIDDKPARRGVNGTEG